MWGLLGAISAFLSHPLVAAVSTMPAAIAGVNEVQGKNIRYSTFSDAGKTRPGAQVPSKVGMVAMYSPAAVTALVATIKFPETVIVPASMMAIHFSKRVLESLFLHRYRGSMPLNSLASISAGYLFITVFIIYAQGTVAPSLDLKPAGIILFIVGISGNLYHHYLLSKLKQGRERGYKIPTGGLFGFVTCPHYLFEILTFAGIACASQTVYSFSVMASTTFYLMGRSWATTNWYISKFPDYPREIKALVPFIF